MDLIDNKYRVLKTLGVGGMGEVYLVLPPHADPVALKLLRSEVLTNKNAIQQFENEFKVLKKLSHPNIGQIYDYGYDQQEQKVYFTCPWLKGVDLYAATKDLPVEKCEEYFVQMLRAVNYLHQKDLIHCDLKPDNIYVEDDKILLIDFGLAGYWGESIVGTPTYLAPEVFRGKHHSVASDLYAIGVIMYTCLTRTKPFSGTDIQEVYDRHRNHHPAPINKVNSKVPAYYNEIIRFLLAKKPEERYVSAAAVIEDLAAYSGKDYSVETEETLLSYLPSASELIGRQEALTDLEKQVGLFIEKKHDKPFVVCLLHGEKGVGRTKFINHIRNHLQLNKIRIENIHLPIEEGDKKIIHRAEALILEDLEEALDGDKADFASLISVMEEKLIAPETERLLFLVSATQESQWDRLKHLFPEEAIVFSSIHLPPFTQEETSQFLENVIGQEEIPDQFVSELFRNTGGVPGLIDPIVSQMIEKGLLFDKSGRWSADLLAHLGEALKKIEPPKSLQERLQVEYTLLPEVQRDIVHWLALCPDGLTEKSLKILTNGAKVSKILKEMMASQVVRVENKKYYFLYRSTFVSFVQKKLPDGERRKRHSRLTGKDIKLSQEERWYHMSYGEERERIQPALDNLGKALALKGEKAKALDCYERLLYECKDAALPSRVSWTIKAAEILIWMDRFENAELFLAEIEKEIKDVTTQIPLKSRLLIWEKKGLSLLGRREIEAAQQCFLQGLQHSQDNDDVVIEHCRFLNDLAQIDLKLGEVDEAIKKFLEAEKQAVILDHKQRQQITNSEMGRAYAQLQKFAEAITFLEGQVKLFSDYPYREPLVRSLYDLADCLRATQNFPQAIKQYEKCIKICQKEQLLPILLRAYNGLGNIYFASQKLDDALKTYQKALEICIHLKDNTTKAALLVNQGIIYSNQKKVSLGTRRFLLAKQLLESKEDRLAFENSLLSKCYYALAQLSMETKNSMKALTFQLDRLGLVEESEALAGEKFSANIELARLFLHNRLGDRLEEQLPMLEELAQEPEEIKELEEIKTKWNELKNMDKEVTEEVG